VRLLLAAAGSRGDTQPLLALAVALKGAGHSVELSAAPNFAGEASAFGIPFHPVGMDQAEFIRDRSRFSGLTPWKAVRLVQSVLVPEIQAQFEALVPLARSFEGIIGGGAQFAAHSIAEAGNLWYRYVAYTPQVLRSRYHPPLVIHWNLPRVLNGLTWTVIARMWRRLAGPVLAEGRNSLGLQPVEDIVEYAFPTAKALLAFDPELMPVPPDVHAPQPPTGAWHLADPRPLEPDLSAFLEQGEPPVYIGFGSIPDAEPESTTRMIEEALGRVQRRAVVNAGLAGLGERLRRPDIYCVASVNHRLLFPRCAAIVHHGGAGTTAAATRAGMPQVVVPHGFDQFNFARRVHRQGLGAPPLPRTRLSAPSLAGRLESVLRDDAMGARAKTLGERIRARDPMRTAIDQLSVSTRG
jgi:vancomycin aglycone glucosyltransferase